MSGKGAVAAATLTGTGLGLATVVVPLIVGATDSYEILDPLVVMGFIGSVLGFLVGLMTVSFWSTSRR